MAKTKLTPELQKRIVDLVRAGNYPEIASGAVGIHEDTYNDWIRGGKLAKSGIFHSFYIAVKAAEKEGEAALVATVRKSSVKNADDAKWILVHRFKDRWATRHETTGKGGEPVKYENATDDADYLTRKLSELASRAGAGSVDSEPAEGETA